MAGSAYRRLSFSLMNQTQIVYLIHLIEFVDLTDGVPFALKVHPNLQKPASAKIAFLEETMRILNEKYEPRRTDIFVQNLISGKKS